jgi:hypothetical protein
MLYLIELTRAARDTVDYAIGCNREVRRQYIADAPYMLVWLPTAELVRYVGWMSQAYMMPVTNNVLIY